MFPNVILVNFSSRLIILSTFKFVANTHIKQYGPQPENACLWVFVNNTGADMQSDQLLCYWLFGKYHIYPFQFSN